MKRSVLLKKLILLYEAMLVDINNAMGSVLPERDKIELFKRLNTRGIGFVTLDLPSLSSALLRGLEDGRLPPTPRFKAVPRAAVPEFLQGLWCAVFDKGSGFLLEDADPIAIKALETICNFAKKMRLPASEKVKKECINAYYKIESDIASPTRFWWDLDYVHPILSDGPSHRLPCFTDDHVRDELKSRAFPASGDEPSAGREHSLSGSLLDAFQQYCDRFCSKLPEYNPSSEIWWERKRGRVGVKHGPGAVASGSKITDKYHFKQWSSILDSVFDRDDFLPSWEDPVDDVLPSRLCIVPKDSRKVRLIAAEPLENQWCQQLTAGWLSRNVLSKVDGQIDLRNQDLSRDMARAGSIDGSNATIDLSDASDRLSLYVVERCFRKAPSLLRALRAHRTQYLRMPDGNIVRLHKFATQGTAVTFPVQSLVYWLVSRFVSERVTSNGRGVRVFGDDMIVPVKAYSLTVHMLHVLGLKVNTEKSFSQGYFRESCGGNFYKGENVTPLRLLNTLDTEKPNSLVAIRDVSNNCFKNGYWHLANALRELDPRRHNRPVVKILANGELEGAGYCSYVGGSKAHLKWRYNPTLQRDEYRVWRLLTKQLRSNPRDLSRLNKALYEMPYLSEHYSSDIVSAAGHSDVAGWDALY